MCNFSKLLPAVLIGAALLSSCSRPAAYFQPTAREHFTATRPAVVPDQPLAPSVALSPPVSQANAALDQVEALVSTDRKLATNKSVQKRLNRIRTALAAASPETTTAKTAAPRKLNVLERVMLKKMNKRIHKQLAPNNPDKVMASKDILTAGAVLLLGGLLLVLLTSGAGAVIGIIALVVGLVMLLIGLL